MLYSVGPDGNDDGGTPIADPKTTSGMVITSSESKGDIVAGVNMQ